jgi:hypothetical protein
MKQNKLVDGTHVFNKKMIHTLIPNITPTKQFNLYLVLNLNSLSTMTSMNQFTATLCSMDYYVKPQHLYKECYRRYNVLHSNGNPLMQ